MAAEHYSQSAAAGVDFDVADYERVDFTKLNLDLPRYTPIRAAVQRHFGFEPKAFQVSAIADIIEGEKDVFVIAGTNSGKSLLYQAVPVVKESAICLVICPTLALMSDQIRHLQDQNIKAVQLTADILRGNPGIWNQVQDGEYSVVFASPEVLLRDGSFFWEVIIRDKKCAFSKRLRAVVINECHLVWGWREFRKDYLSLGAIRAHFQHLPFVALSATIIPNVFKFIINSVGLRPGLRLYKAAIDRQNITQMVAQIDPAQGYAQLSALIPITGAAWRIPKSMIFVDTIDECISISTYLRNGLSSSMAEYRRMVVRPFHASLEVSLREEYLNTFRDGETRVLVCTGTYHITRDNSNMGTKELCIDAAGMGVDIPDIEVVMQWKISPHLTIATLWQRIGRAGRDPEVKAISVLFVDQKQILPKEIPEGSEWVDFDLAVSEQTEERIWELIKRMYVGVENGNLTATATPYHRVDPPILWYVNTTGCRCRCIMAIFLDYNAFSHQPRVEGCCDNMVVSLGQESEFVRSGIDMRASIRYLETRDGLAQEAAKHILAEQRNAEKRAVKTSTAQHFEVRSALDIWAKSTFGSQHRLYFSPSIRAKLAGDARRLDTRDAIVTELDGRDFCFQESRLWTHAEAILTVMREALTTEDDDVEQEQSIQRSSSGNDNRNGTIVTTTDAPLPDISQLDISQSATGSAHGDHEEAIDNHTVLAGVPTQSTEESQQGSTALLRDFAVPSFLSSLPGFTLPELSVHDLAAARARLLADSAFSFTSNETHRNVTPTPTTASRAVTPQATAEAQKSIPRKRRRDSQQTAIKAIQRKTASTQKAKEKNALKKSSTHGPKRTKRRTLMNDDMT